VVNEETDKILLIQQYGRAQNILVAGYVNRGEQEGQAVIREVYEETGMHVSHIKFNRTSFYEPSNTLMCNFTAFVENDKDLNPNHEIDSCAWFTKEEARQNILPNSLASYFLNAYLDE
ncbi:MAG: NUDIX domain-containing protein, partial [Firmicutes bacterium]|nr:NUDIX domain-containing protein [Bacillota bacterium]